MGGSEIQLKFSKVSVKSVVSAEVSNVEGSASKLPYKLLNQLPISSWLQPSCSSLLCGIPHGSGQNMSTSFPQSALAREGSHRLFGSDLTEDIYYHFCHIYSSEASFYVQFTLKGNGYTGYEHQVDIFGGHLRCCQPQLLIKYYVKSKSSRAMQLGSDAHGRLFCDSDFCLLYILLSLPGFSHPIPLKHININSSFKRQPKHLLYNSLFLYTSTWWIWPLPPWLSHRALLQAFW